MKILRMLVKKLRKTLIRLYLKNYFDLFKAIKMSDSLNKYVDPLCLKQIKFFVQNIVFQLWNPLISLCNKTECFCLTNVFAKKQIINMTQPEISCNLTKKTKNVLTKTSLELHVSEQMIIKITNYKLNTSLKVVTSFKLSQ